MNNIKSKLKKILGGSSVTIPYSIESSKGTGAENMFCPHPFTNWSLNPGYINSSGQKDHTSEGFRRTNDESSVIDCAINQNRKKIYCVGGSTTYCTGLNSYKQAWPSKLYEIIKEIGDQKDCAVFNAGVGGWGTLQSLVRLQTWGPVIKPYLIIVYQAKNDLTYFYNGNPDEKSIYPDYANIVGQITQIDRTQKPFLHTDNMDNLIACYGKNAAPSAHNLKRFSEAELKATLFRYEMMINVAEKINAKVLFLPEIMTGSPYLPYVNKINRSLENLLKDRAGCFFFAIDNIMSKEDKYFLDKCHFTEEGCNLFASLLAKYIASNRLLT